MRRVGWKDILAIAVLCGGVPLGAAAVYWHDLWAPARPPVFSPHMSIRELAERNGVPPSEIVHMLSHEDHSAWNWSRRAPVSTLPVDLEVVRHALEHAAEEDAPVRDLLRFVLWGGYLAACLMLLALARVTARLRTILLLSAVVVFGITLGASPNPMEALVKVLKVARGMEADPFARVAILCVFALMAIVGNKLICGWGCQLGALQDLVHRISPLKKMKRWQVPFWLANTVRMILFLVFIDLFLGGVFGTSNFVVYHHVNFFKLYRWALAPVALTLVPVLALLSLVVYRPFCQFVCPFGLFSWILETASVYRVRIDRARCINCGKCVAVCPTEAMGARLRGTRSFLLPDCWACGACVEACPVAAVVFDRALPEPAETGEVETPADVSDTAASAD